MVSSLVHPIIPLGGGRTPLSGLMRGSSPISKGVDAKEYWSENTLGSIGIRLRSPHFWLGSSSPKPGLPPPPAVVYRWLVLPVRALGGFEGWGISKTCKVDLSDVTASSFPEGDIATERITAGSTPRRTSASRAQLLVAKTRTSVP